MAFLKLPIITIISREILIKEKNENSHEITCVNYFTFFTAFKFMLKKFRLYSFDYILQNCENIYVIQRKILKILKYYLPLKILTYQILKFQVPTKECHLPPYSIRI